MKIVFLCSDDDSSRIMFHALTKDVEVAHVILEDKVPASQILKRRLKTLGVVTVFGQILFMIYSKILAKWSSSRVSAILSQNNLCTDPFPTALTTEVDNVNQEQVIELLKQYQPDAIVVNGTRIIKSTILDSVDATFINTHMGITPKYRGTYGGYWAVASGDIENCGVTVHLVDSGIDTGGILYQDRLILTPKDNCVTYPTLQILTAIPLMKAALNDVKSNRIHEKSGVKPSKLWSHPTLWGYIKNYLLTGAK